MTDKRTTTIRARVSHSEHATIVARAAERHLTISEYLRQSALGMLIVTDVIEIPRESEPAPRWWRRLLRRQSAKRRFQV